MINRDEKIVRLYRHKLLPKGVPLSRIWRRPSESGSALRASTCHPEPALLLNLRRLKGRTPTSVLAMRRTSQMNLR